MYNTLDENPPRYWAAARAFEYIVPIEFVYKKTGDEFCWISWKNQRFQLRLDELF